LRRLLDPAAAPRRPISRRAAALAIAFAGATAGLAFSLLPDETTPVDGPAGLAIGQLPMTPADARALQGQWAAAVDQPVRSVHTPAKLAMTLIPPGEFGLSTECRVTVSRPFLVSTHEITVGQFKKFVEATGYVTESQRNGKGGWIMDRTNYHAMQQRRPEFIWTNPGYAVLTDDYPVTQLTWNDANAFCEWLTTTDTIRYRLPTEAEWRWACRAGCAGEFYFGDNANLQKENSWYVMNAFEQPQPVGRLAPNAWGLYDALGNVAEWCADGFHDYPRGHHVDYRAPVTNDRRVLAGGSHLNTRVNCIMREPGVHSAGLSFAGCRVVGELPAR
jgi:formylglycine-generating enzyme required for sulfatase activity